MLTILFCIGYLFDIGKDFFMIVAGGITTLKPIGGLVTNNPAMTDAQAQQQQKAAQERAEAKQAAVDAMVNKFAETNANNAGGSRWRVPFN
jgi:hypothetical protein